MKNKIEKIRDFANEKFIGAQSACYFGFKKMKNTLENNNGEGYIDTAVKILISVVLGALLLAALYALFKNVVLSKTTSRVNGMFDYNG